MVQAAPACLDTDMDVWPLDLGVPNLLAMPCCQPARSPRCRSTLRAQYQVLRTRTTCTGYYCSIIECCTWPVLSPGFLGFFSTLFLFASLLARTRTRRETWSCTHMEVPGCLLEPPPASAPLGRAGRRYSSVVVAGTDPGPRVSSLQLLSRLGCPLQLCSAP